MKGVDGLRVMVCVIPLALYASRIPVARADARPDLEQAAAEYASTVKPLLSKYCLDCHATEVSEGDLDLERFANLGDVRKQIGVWLKVAEKLDSREMPPKEGRRMPKGDRQALRGWLALYLKAEIAATEGDPGPVVLRRLGNAQYTYTLRDLTGVPVDPAREFPVDGAAGEGFTNTGNALVMSPSLLAKYFDAAKGVADHAVPLPDGLRFSPSTTRRDWTNEIVGQIRAFYAEFTDPGAGTQVNLQGVVFDTNAGGRLPLEHYIDATLEEREALGSGAKSIEDVAHERHLSPKYLGRLWSLLNGRDPSPLLDGLRTSWKAGGPSDAKAIARSVEGWQSRVWKFNRVGHIGKVGGPKSWMEPVSPLLTRQEFRVGLPSIGKDVTVYLVADEAGDGSEQDEVVWERPRLVAPGMPDLMLRDLPSVLVSRTLVVPAHSPPGPSTFGRLPGGGAIDPASLGVKAPSVIEVKVPADLAEGCEFVVSGSLATGSTEGSVQLGVSTEKPGPRPKIDPARPVVVTESGPARARFEAAFDTFRQTFPPALCYVKIVPVDEVITLMLFYREDDLLRRLMLDDAQAERLDRLWAELRFVSQDALKLVDAFQQLLEYASQDADPSVFAPLRRPILDRASAFRKALVEAEPRQVDAVLSFAEKAYRRPLKPGETAELRHLYRKLRDEGLPHDEAWRLVLARILISPAFLYRLETPGPGARPSPVTGHELATRLSYFLWSSAPDNALRDLADSGRLRDPDILASEARRMLKDDRVRRLSTEFACQWLHVYDFDNLDEKSERHFPTFNGLRGAMYEETILFFTDLFQRDQPALSILDADYTFLNAPLADHYGIPDVSGDEWRRVEGIKKYGRGGILGLSATLAKQSGASRTSPILRGNWVSEVLLGERLPKPPPGIPQLPDDEAATGGLSVRELVERHTRDPKCAVCHTRIDPIGFSLEAYDAIGRRRETDVGGRPVEVDAKMKDGTEFSGLDGLRTYLLTDRREAVARQFCRKLLGYALGRSVQFSDEPLLDEMTRIVTTNGPVGEVVETIVRSPQFREIRGRDTASSETP